MLRYLLLSIVLLLWSLVANSMSWTDLWWRKDQRGMHLLMKGKNEQAAHTFESHPWRGVADYRSGKYQKVEQDLKNEQDPVSRYNLGNALALQGKYQEAIDAYSQAIKEQPNFKDAIYNRDLIKKLLQKNEQQKKQQDDPKADKQQQQKQKPEQKNNDNSQQNQDPSKQDNDQQAQSNPQNNQDNKENKENPQDNPNKQQDDQNQEQPPPGQKDGTSQQQKQGDDNEGSQSEEKSKATNQEDHGAGANKQGETKHEAGTDPQEQQVQTAQPKGEIDKKLDQETDQWLQQITDDPGDLLRRKILRDHLRKIRQQ